MLLSSSATRCRLTSRLSMANCAGFTASPRCLRFLVSHSRVAAALVVVKSSVVAARVCSSNTSAVTISQQASCSEITREQRAADCQPTGQTLAVEGHNLMSNS